MHSTHTHINSLHVLAPNVDSALLPRGQINPGIKGPSIQSPLFCADKPVAPVNLVPQRETQTSRSRTQFLHALWPFLLVSGIQDQGSGSLIYSGRHCETLAASCCITARFMPLFNRKHVEGSGKTSALITISALNSSYEHNLSTHTTCNCSTQNNTKMQL